MSNSKKVLADIFNKYSYNANKRLDVLDIRKIKKYILEKFELKKDISIPKKERTILDFGYSGDYYSRCKTCNKRFNE